MEAQSGLMDLGCFNHLVMLTSFLMVGENNQDAVMEELLLWLAILVRRAEVDHLTGTKTRDSNLDEIKLSTFQCSLKKIRINLAMVQISSFIPVTPSRHHDSR